MRTYVYIDGFNFYYGAVKDTPYKWLDFKKLLGFLLKPDHNIELFNLAIVNIANNSRIENFILRNLFKRNQHPFLLLFIFL